MLGHIALLCSLLIALATASDLSIVSNLHYDDVSQDCSFLTDACAPLSDVWGFEGDRGDFALVGVANGVDLVNATDRKAPTRMGALVRGCVTEWRDIKVFQDTVFIVNDETSLCHCEQQPCQLQIYATTNGDTTALDASEGGVGKPLDTIPGGVEGMLALVEGDGCSEQQYHGMDFRGKVLGIQRDNCTFGTKVHFAQEVGAIAVVVFNHRQDIIYPSMAGNGSGVDIPVVIIGKDSADWLIGLITSGESVTVRLDASLMVDSPYYAAPDGLVVASIADVNNFHEIFRTRDYFDFAHNLIIDTARGIMYVCGYVPGSGGILAFSLSDGHFSGPEDMQLIGWFNDTYIHDVEVEQRADGTHVLYGCGIYSKQVFVFDVTDPAGDYADKILATINTIEWPHNSAATEDDRFLYITHEEFEYPITVWNVEDLNNIYYVSNISFGAERGTIPHNAFVDGERLWMSYYSEGVLVFDIGANPANPPMLGHADTSPAYTAGFHGVWGVYVLGMEQDTPPSNHAYASDIENGFFVLELLEGGSTTDSGWVWYALGGVLALLVIVGAAGAFVAMRRRKTVYVTNEEEDGVEVL